MTTRLDPWGTGVMEMATRSVIPPGSVGVAQAHPLTKPPAVRKQPDAGLGPVTTVHPMIPIRASCARHIFSLFFLFSCINLFSCHDS